MEILKKILKIAFKIVSFCLISLFALTIFNYIQQSENIFVFLLRSKLLNTIFLFLITVFLAIIAIIQILNHKEK